MGHRTKQKNLLVVYGLNILVCEHDMLLLYVDAHINGLSRDNYD